MHSIRLLLPSQERSELWGWKEAGDTGKDEAEFILLVGEYKVQDEAHREAGPWGAPCYGQEPHFSKCQAHCVPPGHEDPESRNWARVGWWEEDRVLPRSCPDHVSDFHRKEEQLGDIVI